MTGDKSAFWTTMWRTVGVLAVFALLTTLHTWPLVPQVSARISPNGDVPVNVWGLNDLAGQILNDPKHLLDGRIHYPYPHTLAFVDHQIASALLAVPLVASGRDAITIYNVVFLASFWLSGVFCYLLVRDLTGSVGAGLVAGSLFAFSTYRFHHVVHLHLLGTQWLPLALLALHRFLARPSWVRLIGVVGSGLLVAVSSWQLGIIGAVGLGIAALTTMLADGRPLLRRAGALVLVATVIGLTLVPLATVYSAASADWGRPGGETTGSRVDNSVRPASFVTLERGSRTPYAPLLRRTPQLLGVFPGVIALLLAGLAVWTLIRFTPGRTRGRSARVLLWLGCTPVTLALVAASLGGQWLWVVDVLRPIAPVVIFSATLAVVGIRFARRVCGTDPTVVVVLTYTAIAVAGGLLALGPAVLVGDTYLGLGVFGPDSVPPLSLLRAPERFTLLFTLGVSVLAGVGVTSLLRRRKGIARWVVSATVLLVLYVDTRHAPFPLTAAPPSRPPVYAWLASTPEEGAVLEFPWRDNPWIVYNNLDHGRRMVHGQSYIRPYPVDELEELPDLSPSQLALLWEHFHPRFIVVRAGLYPPDVRTEVMRSIQDQPRALRLRARFGDDHVYELFDRGTGAHLYRVWPRDELVGRRGFAITARVTGVRDGAVPGLVVTLNGSTVLDARGNDAVRDQARVMLIDPGQLSPGLNTLELRADYRFGDGEPGYAVGTTGVSLAADVVVTAAQDRAMIEVNGRSDPVEKGYTLAVLDADTGEITDLASFNTSWYLEDSARLAAFVGNIPVGAPVLVSSEFDVSRHLTDAAGQALRTLGLGEDLRGRDYSIHAAIGAKGAPPGSALECVDRRSCLLTLGEQANPRVELGSLSLH